MQRKRTPGWIIGCLGLGKEFSEHARFPGIRIANFFS